MKVARVQFPVHFSTLLEYDCGSFDDISVGSFVKVPFKKKESIGVVWELSNEPIYKGKLEKVIDIIKIQPINKDCLEFINKVSYFNVMFRGDVLKMMMSPSSVFDIEYNPRKKIDCFSNNIIKEINLNDEQKLSTLKIDEILSNKFHKTLLIDGVTGSGKTETYFHLLKKILEDKSQALVLVPEISLSIPWIDRFSKYFGMNPWVWHSDIKKPEKTNIWRKIISGEKGIVVGARSALFLPFSNLKGIVVDEEHDTSYKQEERGFYNARDMAIVRGNICKIPVILSSATPSLETIYNVNSNKYEITKLKKRFFNVSMPDTKIVNMENEIPKNKYDCISVELHEGIKKCLELNEQSFLFLNRRGHDLLIHCTSCGTSYECPNCSFNLVYHQLSNKLKCHYCDYSSKITDNCLKCGENSIIKIGIGVEKLSDILKKRFPDARIQVVSTDTITNMESSQKIISSIVENEVDIIIGTQVFAKGHHFPNLTLVGIIDADQGVNQVDIRSREKIFQLISQVGGRAGRESKKGNIILQTYMPDNSFIKILESCNRDLFYKDELESREKYNLPPFSRIISIIVSSPNKINAEETVNNICNYLNNCLGNNPDVSIHGPIPANKERIKSQFRYKIIINCNKNKNIFSYFNDNFSNIKSFCKGLTKVFIDIDSQSLI